MENLITVINKLQNSAGKSSVIESIVGNSFLPRGTGIVTRRSLVLQLVYCPKDDRKHRSADNDNLEDEVWGEFLHNPNEIFFDFDEIRKEIEDETDRVAGSNKRIVNDEISLTIFSNEVVNLTLVDLPGITKVPVGDQPQDIEEQIKKLVLKYIENPNSIILAVQAANADLATSEALKIAKDMDPEGKRTLAVLTKLDLMDEGTNALDVLEGKIIPVKLSIIGVVNRSQLGITENRAIEDQFSRRIIQKNGTIYLAKTLSRLLMNHIHDCLPDLKKRVNDKTAMIQLQLKAYGKEVTDKNQTLINVITEFSQAYSATIEASSSRDYVERQTCILSYMTSSKASFKTFNQKWSFPK